VRYLYIVVSVQVLLFVSTSVLSLLVCMQNNKHYDRQIHQRIRRNQYEKSTRSDQSVQYASCDEKHNQSSLRSFTVEAPSYTGDVEQKNV
jgi:hypothetical protein